uniref:N5-glutamine methyltransferase family protein n=1 Tax=Paenibacillus gorillae TaxID=1243662 RepID=UPI0005A76B6D
MSELEFFAPSYTIREACLQASSFLAGHGVEESRSNAELLLLHVLKVERSVLLRDWSFEQFPPEKAEAWVQAVRRKAEGEPVQYIIGEQWFYGRPFTVTPAVLIPRPETELLVEAVLEAADSIWPPEGAAVPTVLDVGTGSGAIAVTLASQRPRWRVSASDLSPDALEVARMNAV